MLTVVLPFYRAEETAKVCLTLLRLNSDEPHPLIVVDESPGETNFPQFLEHWFDWPVTYLPMAKWDAGTVAALAEALEHVTTPLAVWLHQDTMVLEKGWDRRVVREFVRDPDLVLLGLFGFERYQRGFLERAGWRESNMVEAEYHGQRFKGFRQAGGVDGFFMALRPEFFRGRVDRNLHNHLYDHDFSLQALAEGKRVGVLGVYCHHNRAASSQAAPEETAHLTAKWLGDARVKELLVT